MIARIWHGRVPAGKADDYDQYLLKTGVKDYLATPGNRGVHVMRRPDDRVTHFEILTFWNSIEAIKTFAGQDYERARYYAEDDDFLLEQEPNVTHFEVSYSSSAQAIQSLHAAKTMARWMAYFGLGLGVIYSIGGFFYDLFTTGVNWGTALAFLALMGMPLIFGTLGFICGGLFGFTTNAVAESIRRTRAKKQ
ncbi:MAG: hypothetical protein OEY63_08535 [Gemmatimonadota bacterium]|nr:hypothetical protein [Gemmatimonadota bacterium]